LLNDTFVKHNLQNEQQPRDDYKKFLELIVLFLGDILPRRIAFHALGAVDHARWMAKALYCLKIFLFQKQFKLNAKKIEEISVMHFHY